MVTGDLRSGGHTSALVKAAVLGGTAPSAHNSQPWRWRVGPDVLDLLLERSRVLATADPDARLAVLSCGVALHHARLELAASGWLAEVERRPTDPGDHLARIRLAGRTERSSRAGRLVRASLLRRTDRRSRPSAPLDHDKLRTIAAAIRREDTRLTLLRPPQTHLLAAAVRQSCEAEGDDPAALAELDQWVGVGRRSGTGIPAGVLGSGDRRQALQNAGTTAIRDVRDHVAVLAVLSTTADTRPDRLRAGEALSAGWLTATTIEVSVLPLSSVIEVAASRSAIRDLIGDGHPQLVLRFAAGEPDSTLPRSPRLPAAAIIEHVGGE
ncbi:Acg family FMN-binding oxidoreductase [Actinoplanes sp. NPDC049265]|uniref:Acg family FMN-binding oxidoreductase n=1 Tax=Actinoplanes sp. NPDC049265 TaxID=3363902 RepID=UPI003718B1F4